MRSFCLTRCRFEPLLLTFLLLLCLAPLPGAAQERNKAVERSGAGSSPGLLEKEGEYGKSASQPAAPKEVWRLTLKSGQVLRGWGVSSSDEEVVIELAPGVTTSVKRSALASLSVESVSPGAAGSGAPDSGTSEPGASESGAVESGAVESGAVESGAVESGAVESGAVDSESAQSGSGEAGSVGAGSSESGALESEASESASPSGQNAGQVEAPGVESSGGSATAESSEPATEEAESLYAEHLEEQVGWFQDKNRHRYLYAPSAMMNPRGQGSISQIELFFTSFNYALTDWMNVQVGGALPLWFIDGGFNLIGGVKFGGQVLKYLHLAAGAQNLVMAPDGRVGTIGVVYGATTFGTPNLNLSLLVGMPWQVAAGDLQNSVDLPVINLSGIWRFSEHMAVSSENWLFPGSFGASYSAPYLLSLALRAMTENLSADVGFVVVPLIPFPVPWLSGTWTFGG